MPAQSQDAMSTTGQMPGLLVIDDDADILALLSRYFGANGYRVIGAANAAQARELVAVQTIDLVLLDLGLPDEDGLSLLRHLQAQWRGPVNAKPLCNCPKRCGPPRGPLRRQRCMATLRKWSARSCGCCRIPPTA